MQKLENTERLASLPVHKSVKTTCFDARQKGQQQPETAACLRLCLQVSPRFMVICSKVAVSPAHGCLFDPFWGKMVWGWGWLL